MFCKKGKEPCYCKKIKLEDIFIDEINEIQKAKYMALSIWFKDVCEEW